MAIEQVLDGSERRTEHRHSLSVPAKVQVGHENYRPARTLDLSRNGARLELQTPVLRGSQVALSISPEPMRHVTVSGVVVWLASSWRAGVFEAGVRFQNAGRADRVWLEKSFP